MPEGTTLTSQPSNQAPVHQPASQHQDNDSTANSRRNRSGRGRRLLIVALVTLIAGGLVAGGWAMGYIGGDNDESNSEIEKLKAAAPSSDQAERDQRLREAIVGEWEMSEEGIYRLTLRPDSTGTMVYLPNRKYQFLLAFTKRLEIEITWELKNGHVDMVSKSGKPERAFKIAIADRGKQKYFRIDELTVEKMTLYELKKKKTDRWRKIKSAEQVTSPTD